MKQYLILVLLFLICRTELFGQTLHRYSCLVDRNDVVAWEKDSTRSFDGNGIIMNNDIYHPAGILQYGLLCHDRFVTTGDSVYYRKMYDQVKYLKDSTLVVTMFDGKGIGLPYQIEYNGLQPPWYSGMTQGLAISFLLRYTAVSGDTALFKLIGRLAHVMLQPQELGGCLSKTDQNLLWIEEYPNTPESPQVLNGFIFGLFGLMEYCQYFPSDDRANRIMLECLSSLKTALPYYDSRSWTRYNRRTIYPNRVDYIRLQIFQMQQLYQMTGDPIFLRQGCIWSAFITGMAVEKPDEWTHFDELDMAIPGHLSTTEIIPGPVSPHQPDEFEKEMILSGRVPNFPWYSYATTEVRRFDSPTKIHLSLDTNVTEVHMLYRYHWDEKLLDSEKWQAQNGVSLNETTFTLMPGFCQFAIFYRLSKPDHRLQVFNFDVEDHQ